MVRGWDISELKSHLLYGKLIGNALKTKQKKNKKWQHRYVSCKKVITKNKWTKRLKSFVSGVKEMGGEDLGTSGFPLTIGQVMPHVCITFIYQRKMFRSNE